MYEVIINATFHCDNIAANDIDINKIEDWDYLTCLNLIEKSFEDKNSDIDIEEITVYNYETEDYE